MAVPAANPNKPNKNQQPAANDKQQPAAQQGQPAAQEGPPKIGNPGLDPSTDPKIVVKAVNPPVTPDQVVGMAEMPAAATLDLPKIENIKIPPVKNKTIQGHLKAIEAKMAATEKLMKDVVKLQKVQILTEKELFERKRELYQNTFEEYLLDKTVDFENPDALGGGSKKPKKPGGGFPFFGGGRRKGRKPGGGGVGPGGLVPPSGGLETEVEKEKDPAKTKPQNQPNLNDKDKDKSFNPVEASKILEEIYGEANPEIFEETPEEIPQIIPQTKPIVPPKKNQDPAEIGEEIEALQEIYRDQPAFSGGLLGNLIPPEAKIYEREDGYVIIVSPNARQDGELPNPFANDGKVKVLPPTVAVLRPEDVAALQGSDEAKVAKVMQVYNAVQDVIAAAFAVKTSRNSRRRPGTGSSTYSKVNGAKIQKVLNNIRKTKPLTKPAVKSTATTDVVPQTQTPTTGLTKRQKALMRGGSRGESGKSSLTGRKVSRNQRDQENVDRQVENLSNQPIPEGIKKDINVTSLEQTFKKESARKNDLEFIKNVNESIKNKASGGYGDVELYNSESLNYFRGMSSKIMPMADGGLAGWWNKGRNMRVPNENTARWRGPDGLMADDAKQLTRTNKAFKSGATGIKGWNPFKAFTPEMVKTGPTPAVRQAFERPVRAVGRGINPSSALNPFALFAELIINELVNPAPTATYDQVTGPNAYYNAPGYKGPMPSQNLENAQGSMMSGKNEQKLEVTPLPPDYIKIPGKKKAPSFVGDDSPDIFMRTSVFTRSSTNLD